MKPAKIVGMLITLAACSVAMCVAESINWYSMNAGGGTSRAVGYVLNGSVGQAAAGVVKSPPYQTAPRIHYIGFWAGGLDQLAAPLALESIGDAKRTNDGVRVTVSGVRATSNSTADFGDRLYVEQADRSSGIQVFHGGALFYPVAEGDEVRVTGTLTTTADGERALERVLVYPQAPNLPLRSVGLRIYAAGGSDLREGTSLLQRGVGVPGLNNVGLLVRVWGRNLGTVTENTPSGSRTYLLIEDGSYPGGGAIRVDTSRLIVIPTSQYVQVTGISSVENRSRSLIPVIRPRRQSDIQQL